MKYNEFEVKIDGVQIKVKDKYILINSTIEIMLNQISEVMINEPDWLGVGKFERFFKKLFCFLFFESYIFRCDLRCLYVFFA